MIDRRFFAELVALIVAAALCAAAANLFASRERRLAWAGDYPNALVVPQPPPPATGGVVLPEPAAVLTPVPDEGATTGTVPAETPAEMPAPVAASPASTTTEPAAKAPATQPAPAQPQITLSDFPGDPAKPSVDATPEEVMALHRLGATFIDARRSQVYEQGRIAGSLSMPVWESDIDERVVAFYEAGHDQEAPIVIYCSGGACEDSHMLAQKLWGIGYNNIRVYPGGWPDWTGRGLPVERGPAR